MISLPVTTLSPAALPSMASVLAVIDGHLALAIVWAVVAFSVGTLVRCVISTRMSRHRTPLRLVERRHTIARRVRRARTIISAFLPDSAGGLL